MGDLASGIHRCVSEDQSVGSIPEGSSDQRVLRASSGTNPLPSFLPGRFLRVRDWCVRRPFEVGGSGFRFRCGLVNLSVDGNLRQVQKQLGHASPATTANMYADISFEDMQEGVNGLYEQ